MFYNPRRRIWRPERRIIRSRPLRLGGGGAILTNPIGMYPGQPGNPVGFAAAPGYPGSLTPWPALQQPAANTTYSFFDIDSTTFFTGNSTGTTTLTASSVSGGQGINTFCWIQGAGVPAACVVTSFGTGSGGAGTYGTGKATTLTNVACTCSNGFFPQADNITFYGCRFQCNDCGVTDSPGPAPPGSTTNGLNVQVGNSGLSPNNVRFIYCSFTPRTAVVPSIPGGGVWPAFGVGVPNVENGVSAQYYGIGQDQGYQFAIDNWGTNTLVDHCDMWGGGNFIEAHGTGSITVRDCWIHDNAWDGDGNDTSPNHIHYHVDGLGHFDGTGTTSNFIIQHCTIALFGGANCVGFQTPTSNYTNCKVTNSWLSGDGGTIDMGHGGTGSTGMVFTDNVWSSGMQAVFNALENDNSPTFTGIASNVWRRNKANLWLGTVPGRNAPTWTPSQDGQFLWPDGSLNPTDWSH